MMRNGPRPWPRSTRHPRERGAAKRRSKAAAAGGVQRRLPGAAHLAVAGCNPEDLLPDPDLSTFVWIARRDRGPPPRLRSADPAVGGGVRHPGDPPAVPAALLPPDHRRVRVQRAAHELRRRHRPGAAAGQRRRGLRGRVRLDQPGAPHGMAGAPAAVAARVGAEPEYRSLGAVTVVVVLIDVGHRPRPGRDPVGRRDTSGEPDAWWAEVGGGATSAPCTWESSPSGNVPLRF